MKIAAIFAFALLAGPSCATTLDLKDYVTTDKLGGDCIGAENLELSFGKASILPRTCVPDPCVEISADDFYYNIIGRKTDPMVYDAFLRRQDAACPIPTPRARFTDEELMRAVFNGTTIPDQPTNPPPVPLPSSAFALLAALLCLCATARYTRRTSV